ncbi:V-type proton ATPase subunit H [Fragariocoptes setiger]|uniref:V-type proton ATPase subunit H n=1 Tax=Fragariocoptes setiger TaxID=1670756 RepID=A0ABQ7SD65_9ACAR|nr:V-type proton ATPase subunit H [Fragariocoptes setiger]
MIENINQLPDEILLQANEIKANRVSWQSYLQSQMINQEDFNFVTTFERLSGEQRDRFLKENREQCARTFLSLLDHIAKDQTIQYILILIDDMLSEDRTRVEIFREHSKNLKVSVWNPFLMLFNRTDGFIINMSCRIIAKIACWSSVLMEGPDLTLYLSWLRDQLRAPNNQYMQSVARCLQMMLRIDYYRKAFDDIDGIATIESVFAQGRLNFQIQYQLTFCCWVLTFNKELARKMNKYKIIQSLADILSESVKEKVKRIVVSVLRNLIEKVDDREISRENAILMVQCKVMKQLEMLQQSTQNSGDPELIDDVNFLIEVLQASVQDLSSFDEYATELRSGRLEWSPVHNSQKFWRENAHRLNEKNYELLKILIGLLENSKDPLVMSVAAHDLGEYVRHYPRGKVVTESLGGKNLVMQRLAHEDPNVRYEALLCVQKLMVQNWEYLGKQLTTTYQSQA